MVDVISPRTREENYKLILEKLDNLINALYIKLDKESLIQHKDELLDLFKSPFARQSNSRVEQSIANLLSNWNNLTPEKRKKVYVDCNKVIAEFEREINEIWESAETKLESYPIQCIKENNGGKTTVNYNWQEIEIEENELFAYSSDKDVIYVPKDKELGNLYSRIVILHELWHKENKTEIDQYTEKLRDNEHKELIRNIQSLWYKVENHLEILKITERDKEAKKYHNTYLNNLVFNYQKGIAYDEQNAWIYALKELKSMNIKIDQITKDLIKTYISMALSWYMIHKVVTLSLSPSKPDYRVLLRHNEEKTYDIAKILQLVDEL